MAGINGVTVLFRLLSEDSVSGNLNKILGNVNKVESALGKTTLSSKQLEAAMKGAGADSHFDKVKKDLEGTSTAAGKLERDIKKVEASMKDAGASSEQIKNTRTNLEEASKSADKATTANGKLAKSFDGIKLAAGAALTGAGMYMEQFVQKCLDASITIQANNMKIGGSMGLTASQTMAMSPQIDAVLSQVQSATGRNINDLREIMPMVNQVTGGNMTEDVSGMQSISALAYAKPNSNPADIATIYNKMVTSGSPMAMGQFGLSLTDMGTTTKAFKDMDQTERKHLIDAGINAHLGMENADMAGTTAGRMAIFQGKLEVFEGKLGDSFVPFLTGLLGALTPVLDFMEAHTLFGVQLTSIAGGIVLVATVLTLLAGPIIALQALGIGKIVGELWTYVTATEATGNAGVINAAKIWLFGDSIVGSGNAGVINAIKVWLFADAEAGAGLMASLAFPVIALLALAIGAIILDKEAKKRIDDPGYQGHNADGSDLTPEQQAKVQKQKGQLENQPHQGIVDNLLFDVAAQNQGKGQIGDYYHMYSDDKGVPLIQSSIGKARSWLGGLGKPSESPGPPAAAPGEDARQQILGGLGSAGSWLSGIGSYGKQDHPMTALQSGETIGGAIGDFLNPKNLTIKPPANQGNIWDGLIKGNKKASTDTKTQTADMNKSVKNAGEYIKGAWGNTGKWLSNLGKIISDGFWNGVKSMEDSVNKEIENIKKALQDAPGKLWNDGVSFGQGIWKSVVDGMQRRSPGRMYKEVVNELESVNNAFKLYTPIVGNRANLMGKAMTAGFNANVGSLSTQAVHTHYHSPITVDASHMNEQQLMELMIKLNEDTLRPNVVPTVNKNVIPKTAPLPTGVGDAPAPKVTPNPGGV